MKFSDVLKKNIQPIWRKNHSHPFVQEMGYGTLDTNKFRFYMVQDYLYLIDYAKIFALGVVKSNDIEKMNRFAALLHGILYEEMSLHRQYAERFGITEKELNEAKPAPITLAYSHYMLHISQNGTLSELTASLLPCMWSYWEIGKELRKIPGACEHELYGDWVKMYSSDEFGKLTTWCIELVDELAIGKSEEELARLQEIFLNTTRYEYMFWDMAYNEEMWPTDE